MKSILLLLVIFTPYLLAAQKSKTFSIFNLGKQTSMFDSSIKVYVRKFDHSLERNHTIDSIASLRTTYFLKLIAATTQNGSLDKIFDQIPIGHHAHARFFGFPDYFKEPENISYPDALPDIKALGLYVKSEILQEEYWHGESETPIQDKEIIKRALNTIQLKFGSDYLLSGYKESEEHNSIIVKDGNGKYGSSTKILLSKWFNESKNVWEYETIVMNCTSFSKPMKTSSM